jgi:hypothetical protein
MDSMKQMTLTIICFLLGFLVPVAVTGTCAHLIWREGRVHASRPKRLLVVLVSTFFAFWFPFDMALIVQSGLMMTSQQQYNHAKMLSFLWATFSFSCLNSCLNPFLCVIIGQDFQERLFQPLSSALARAFGEEGFITHPVPMVKLPGDAGNAQVEARSLPS